MQYHVPERWNLYNARRLEFLRKWLANRFASHFSLQQHNCRWPLRITGAVPARSLAECFQIVFARSKSMHRYAITKIALPLFVALFAVSPSSVKCQGLQSELA